MRVVEIRRYPLKSAQGEPVDRSPVAELGLTGDRQLALVDVTTGRALTGRREPKLLFLSAAVVGGRARVTTPEGRELATDEALSEWLGRAVRLAAPPSEREPVYDCPLDNEDESGPWAVWSGPTGVWHDSTRTRVTIMSCASLRSWPTRRFRPNIVVDGVALDVTSASTAASWSPAPNLAGSSWDLGVLKTVLRDTDGFLGVGAMVATPGEVCVGDEVTVLQGRP